MRVTFLALAAACALCVATPAHARPSDADRGTYFDANGTIHWGSAGSDVTFADDDGRLARRGYGGRGKVLPMRTRHAGVGPRPRRWCGWWMRTQRGGGPEFNLAWNWRKYGQAASPQVGAVVVWRHHVGEITGRASNGMWIVRSGNDGGRVRERARSVSGAIFRI